MTEDNQIPINHSQFNSIYESQASGDRSYQNSYANQYQSYAEDDSLNGDNNNYQTSSSRDQEYQKHKATGKQRAKQRFWSI